MCPLLASFRKAQHQYQYFMITATQSLLSTHYEYYSWQTQRTCREYSKNTENNGYDLGILSEESSVVVIHGTVPTLVTMTFSALSLELERKHGKLYTGVCRQVELSSISVIFSHLLCHFLFLHNMMLTVTEAEQER